LPVRVSTVMGGWGAVPRTAPSTKRCSSASPDATTARARGRVAIAAASSGLRRRARRAVRPPALPARARNGELPASSRRSRPGHKMQRKTRGKVARGIGETSRMTSAREMPSAIDRCRCARRGRRAIPSRVRAEYSIRVVTNSAAVQRPRPTKTRDHCNRHMS
jgi:hypothetical protein